MSLLLTKSKETPDLLVSGKGLNFTIIGIFNYKAEQGKFVLNPGRSVAVQQKSLTAEEKS